MNFTRSYSLNHAPVVGSGPQETYPDTVGPVPYAAINEGVIDVPSGSATGALFQVPFGAVAVPKALFVKNGGPSGTIEVALNGATGSFVELSAGGSVDVAMPSPVASKPLTQVAVVVGAVQPGLGQIQYIILGD